MADDTNANGASFIATWRDLVAVIRDTSALFLVAFLIIFPAKVNSILTEAGFSEGNIGGFTWKSKLTESDQTLKDVRANNNDLKAQNDKLVKTLAAIKDKVSDTDVKSDIAALENQNEKLRAASDKVEANVKATIASTASLVEKVQIAQADDVQWGVVYGGDVDLVGAQQEVGPVARDLKLTNASIYFRQNSYRSVAVTADRSEAEQLLGRAKTHRADAYIVNMAKWCPNEIKKGGYVECASN